MPVAMARRVSKSPRAGDFLKKDFIGILSEKIYYVVYVAKSDSEQK